jgi:transcriptional regulator with XRE-family HTH domain
MKITFLLFDRIKDLEQRKQESVSYSEIARRTGLSRQTVAAIATNEATDCAVSTLGALLDFFRSEGMAVEVGGLLRIEST